MYEETKHITARLQVLEFLMTQANLADLFRHTDILLFVMYAQNVAEGVTTQYKRMSEGLDISFYVSFPFDEWLRKIQNWKEKLNKPEFQLEHDIAIGEGRALRLRSLMERLCDRNAVSDDTAELQHPYDAIAGKPYHESIVDLEKALDSLKTNLSNLAMLPLKTTKEVRSTTTALTVASTSLVVYSYIRPIIRSLLKAALLWGSSIVSLNDELVQLW